MTFTFVSVLLLSGLVGIHGAERHVRNVLAKVGDSISVPCLYEPRYRDHEKYLCKGFLWGFCSNVVNTNEPRSGRISISDDKIQRIFTVTFHNLTQEDDTDRFWCSVKIDGRLDVKWRFDLSVSKSIPTLYVDQQEVVGYKGKNVAIMCHCSYHEIMEWCRLGSSCVAEGSGTIDGTSVTRLHGGFKVNIRDLKLDSGGWYWCARGYLQMPVHITVLEPAPSTPTTKSPSTTSILQTTPQYSSSISGVDPSTAQITNPAATVGGGDGLQDRKEGSPAWIIATTILIGLLLVVTAALFGWWTIRRSEARRGGSRVTEDSQTGGDPDMLYSNVVFKKHAAASKKSETSDDSVTYSAVIVKGGARLKAEAEETVTYCSVAPH